MPIEYDISVTKSFSSAHQIHGIDGPCARLHGHNFKLEVTVSSQEIDSIGFACDFYEIDKLVEQNILKKIDHQFINDLDEFKDVNPTCENIALWIFRALKKALKLPGVALKEVALWENENFKIRISEV